MLACLCKAAVMPVAAATAEVRRTMVSVRGLLLAAGACMAVAQPHAADADFAQRCEALAAQARISVVF